MFSANHNLAIDGAGEAVSPACNAPTFADVHGVNMEIILRRSASPAPHAGHV